MTSLGAQQCYNSGSFYRDLYVADGAPSQIADISSTQADHAQLWASAPEQPVLFQTATNFLQGLYPPLQSLDSNLATEELANGTSIEGPLNAYQYVHIQGEADNAPDTIWLKGDDACPAWNRASRTYRDSTEYQATLARTAEFYSQFDGLLGPILGAENVSFARAYDVFDLLNTAKIHNESIAGQISDENLDEARYLANEWEWSKCRRVTVTLHQNHRIRQLTTLSSRYELQLFSPRPLHRWRIPPGRHAPPNQVCRR